MATPEQLARVHYRDRARLVRAVAVEARRAWRQVDRADIRGSWRALAGRLLVLLAGAQLAAARQADTYTSAVLDAQGLEVQPAGLVVPEALSGVASDGRDLATLLDRPAIATLTALGSGAPPGRALAAGYATLDMAVRTQVADAGRVADQVAVTARGVGYVRMLNPPSCSRCVVLAGRWYRWNQGFQRHPKCLPAGVAVSGPATLAATRRWFEGELVVVTTASGQRLPITGNHPVLTDRGWLPAHLLQEGDHVVRSTRSQGATALVVPDENQVPSRIEDLWRPDGMVSLDHVPTAAEDFHGDGGHGEVDVVLADRLLRGGLHSTLGQFAQQEKLARRVAEAALLAQLSAADQRFLRLLRPANGIVGGRGLGAPLVGSLAAGADLSGCGHVPDLHPRGFQVAAHDVARDAEPLAQAVLTLSGGVRSRDGLGGQGQMGPRWDAPAGPFTVESRATYAARGEDLRLRLSGQVELDRVVEVSRIEWSGHVYNLTSTEGWFSANGLIVSNCDCIHIPGREDTTGDLRTDPRAYFDSLSVAEQDRIFTQAGAESIRLGADISQVVNARRGAAGLTPAGARITAEEARALRAGREVGRLTPVDVFGRPLLVTTEGTTTRGLAGMRLGARETGLKTAGQRYRSARTPRLMPESILQAADGNRDEAIRLLRRFGYIR